jgi:putative membrane protein
MNSTNYWGMDLIWWLVWLVLLFWIFALPYNIPGQRYRKDTPLDILQKRFALGEITSDEYKEMKKSLNMI